MYCIKARIFPGILFLFLFFLLHKIVPILTLSISNNTANKKREGIEVQNEEKREHYLKNDIIL